MAAQIRQKYVAVLRSVSDTLIDSQAFKAKQKLQGLFPSASVVPKRHYLFLQGIASPFFSELAKALRAQGHETSKIHICLGDRIFWRGGQVSLYRGRFSRWSPFLREFIEREKITDVVLFGDCRPYHASALAVANEFGIETHVFEEGYYRPNWLTLEEQAVNAGSSVPRTPAEILMQKDFISVETVVAVESSFVRRAFWDIAMNVGNAFGIGLYPFYRHHRPINPVFEYFAWIPRLLQRPRRERAAEKAIEQCIAQAKGPIFLLALQLDSDYQVRNHSNFRNMKEVIEQVVASFAACSPHGARLIIKVHPLDNGMVNHRRNVEKSAQRHGVADRVDCIDGGNLGQILLHAAGVVVVNSTVGLHALRDNRPVKVLGNAFYDIAGITSQQMLDDFWRDPFLQDRQLYRAFQKLVMHQTQINGGYYSSQGIELAVKNVLARFAEKESKHGI